MTRHGPDPGPEDRTDDDRTGADTAEDDEVRRLDRELAVANDLAPDDMSRDAPGIAARETP